MINLYEEHAREKAGLSNEWQAYRFETFPHTGEALYIEVTGAVAPQKQRGKYKGRPNWRKLDKSTLATIVLPMIEHTAWVRDWEARTEKCSRCVGEGQVMASYSVESGMTYKECPMCQGTGQKI